MYLEDLLEADNFTIEATKIAGRFREEHRLPLLYQLGVVVTGIEDCASRLEDKGIGPFFIAKGSPVFWNERGRLGKPTVKLGVAFFRGVQIELIEPLDDALFYSSHLDPQGRMVVHHLGFLVGDVDKEALALNREGCPTWVRGTIREFPVTAEFAYMDTVDKAGIIIEFITMKYLGLRLPVPHAIYHALGALQKASGARCWDT
ncbi:MAG TPA: VOC family protein [Deltaproteobacteria bacterium]|nr:VOC family protein [Deltaproteobacteria bacterium]HPP81837.1 VOC family protein [Deltaproteobacteria bacterium]